MKTFYQKYSSPIGEIYLVERDSCLIATVFKCHWMHEKEKFENLEEQESDLLRRAKKQLTEYFAGKRKEFELPYTLSGTDFQNRTWKALGQIPFGQTRSYAEQARLVRNPRAVRAIGRTNGLNPLSIFLPCHRVIGSNGTLTGYAGGLDIKKYLLELEGIRIDNGRCIS